MRPLKNPKVYHFRYNRIALNICLEIAILLNYGFDFSAALASWELS